MLEATLQNLAGLMVPLLVVVAVVFVVVDYVVDEVIGSDDEMVGSDDESDGSDDESDPLAGASIRLESADAQTPDPFFERDAGIEVPTVDLSESPPMSGRVTTGLSGRVADGGAAGLYGSSQGDAVCNAQGLIEALRDPANVARARVWGRVHGLPVEDIAPYVRELTAVRLRFDTRVTNHGFAGGEARPFPSVLQAGTSVLVDRRGVPRVRCSCHNPLTEPLRVDGDEDEQRALDVEELAANPADAWEGFDPAQVVTVEPVEPTELLDAFVVADLTTGAHTEQPTGIR